MVQMFVRSQVVLIVKSRQGWPRSCGWALLARTGWGRGSLWTAHTWLPSQGTGATRSNAQAWADSSQ